MRTITRKRWLSAILAWLCPLLPGARAEGEGPIDPERAANTVILDEAGISNLGIETVTVMEADFEEAFFAIGRIEEIPEKHAVLSSRIAGRVVGISAYEGDQVEAGRELVRVESRQPGDPPPVIALEAPISGLIVDSHVRLGEPVEPDSELLDILDLSRVWAVARIPEDLAPGLEAGKTRAHIRVPALGEDTLDGTLLRFGTYADRESGTVDAIFEVPNPGVRMRPGMRAEFSVVTELRENVMAVPKSAIQGDPGNRVVYVKDFDLPNAFVRAPVSLGSQNDRYVEVTGGLFAGDDVVTTGSYLLGFSGGGGLSLKEALDAAHGHEHNEDGSEMTAEQKAAAVKPSRVGGGAPTALTLFLAIACGVLFLLLILSLATRRGVGGVKSA